MEISNKTFGLVCLAAVAITVYVRAQSVQAKTVQAAPEPTAPAVAEAPKRHRPIPNSALPPSQFATDTTDQPTVDDAPVTLDAPATTPTTAPPAAAKPATDAASDQTADDDLTYQDDIGDMADEAPTNNSVELAERDMLRVMLGQMTPQEQQAFRVMWFSMSPDDRQDFLDQLRNEQSGG